MLSSLWRSDGFYHQHLRHHEPGRDDSLRVARVSHGPSHWVMGAPRFSSLSSDFALEAWISLPTSLVHSVSTKRPRPQQPWEATSSWSGRGMALTARRLPQCIELLLGSNLSVDDVDMVLLSLPNVSGQQLSSGPPLSPPRSPRSRPTFRLPNSASTYERELRKIMSRSHPVS